MALASIHLWVHRSFGFASCVCSIDVTSLWGVKSPDMGNLVVSINQSPAVFSLRIANAEEMQRYPSAFRGVDAAVVRACACHHSPPLSLFVAGCCHSRAGVCTFPIVRCFGTSMGTSTTRLTCWAGG
jgi:hypothetical protein